MTAGMDGVEARRLRKGAVTALICAVATAIICIANLLAAVRPPTAPANVYAPRAPQHSIDLCAAFPFDNGILVGPSLRCPPTRALKGADYKVFQERRAALL
jgi:hypothetical protein